jgi:hypothetical protein
MHITAEMDTEGGRETEPSTACHRLSRGVKHRRTGDESEERRGRKKGDKQLGRSHSFAPIEVSSRPGAVYALASSEKREEQ